jgi:hypothetical protein
MSSGASEENRVENHRDGERAMAPADRQTLEAIFHHPVPHNLHWMDTLRLLTHLGTAEENTDGKYSIRINGKHLVLHKPHSKQLDAREVTELRHYFSSVGISSKFPYGPKPTAASTSVDVIALIDHHGAKLYRLQLSSHPQAETIKPYDPHHFLHHLHHRAELSEEGQRPAEDLVFYDRIADALGEADRIVLLSHGKGVSNAAQFLVERLEKYHPRIYAKVVRQTEADTSAMTEGQVLELGRQALALTA